jgi:hypothetical protein
MALSIRDRVMFDLEQRFGDQNWNDVFDAAVYNANGIRMKGSKKTTSCKACHAT